MKNTIKVILIATTAVIALSACTSRKIERGYIADETAVSAIRPQVDTQDSVMAMLGSPTSIDIFDNNNWYYYSKKSENFAFFKEKITDLSILAIHFDPDGYVSNVNTYTLDNYNNIVASDKTTKTHIREASFLQELFGNIGRFGAGAATSVQPGN